MHAAKGGHLETIKELLKYDFLEGDHIDKVCS